MTEEGKIQLEEFLKAKDRYTVEKFQFEKFAADTSLLYRRLEYYRDICIMSAILMGIASFLLAVMGCPPQYYSVGFVVAVVLIVLRLFLRPRSGTIRNLTAKYLESKGYPKEDEELAFRVFTNARMFSDLPALQNLIALGIIDKIDLDDFDIDLDDDFDFDGDD